MKTNLPGPATSTRKLARQDPPYGQADSFKTKIISMSKMATLLLLLLASMQGKAQDGKLVPSFGGKGWVSNALPARNTQDETGEALFRRPDGSTILVVNTGNQVALTRYLADGSQDLSFGINGFSTSEPVAPLGINYAGAAMQSDGKVVVASYGYTPPGILPNDFIVIRFNVDGSLDQSFDNDGRVDTDLMDSEDKAAAIAIQQDGNIVVTGYTSTLTNGQLDNIQLAVVRYNTNGSLDMNFGTGGKVITNITPANDQPEAITIQQDNKILIAGSSQLAPGSGDYRLLVVRYLTGGQPDNSFDGDGIVLTNLSANRFEGATAIAVQQDQRIVVAGSVDQPSGKDLALVRYTSTGALDGSFDGDGKLIAELSGNEDEVTSLLIQPDNKIVVGGYAYNPATDGQQGVIARFLDGGSPDPAFSGDGKHILNFGDKKSILASIAWEHNQYYLVGSIDPGAPHNRDYALLRLNSDGNLDNSFDQDGLVAGFYPSTGNAALKAIKIQTDGKVLVAGYAHSPASETDMTVTRFLPNGNLDPAFGDGGKVSIDFWGYSDFAYAITLQPDGKILVAGSAANQHEEVDFAIARLLPNGNLDNSFDGDGKRTSDLNGSGDEAVFVHAMANGNILVAGSANTPLPDEDGDPTTIESRYNFAMIAYKQDGSTDLSFGNNGKVITNFTGDDDRANTATIQADGRIVMAGYTQDRNDKNNDILLARYNANGTLDNSFNGSGFVRASISDVGFEDAHAIATQQDQKIVVAGYTSNRVETPDGLDNNEDFVLLRFTPNGALDLSFSGDGIVTTDIPGGDERAYAVALQPDGKIVAAGHTYNRQNNNYDDFALARYMDNGLPDPSFGINGVVTTDFVNRSESASALAVFANRIYVAGTNTQGTSNDGIVAAYQMGAIPAVGSFVLINARTDRDIQELTDGAIINLASIRGKAINIRAITHPENVGSLVLMLSGQQTHKQVEQIAPYALFGNKGTNYRRWVPEPGQYTLLATPYSGSGGKGTAGAPLKVSFTIIDQLTLSGFTLVNSQTNRNIGSLADGGVIDLAVTPHINLKANTGIGITESVRFSVNNKTRFRIENGAPFALAGDNRGNYFGWMPIPGTYTITATPYVESNAGGKPGIPISITITVINSRQVPASITLGKRDLYLEDKTTPFELHAFPNPVATDANIIFSVPRTTYVALTLFDIGGKKVANLFSGKAESGLQYRHPLPAASLPKGVYFCRLLTQEGAMQTIKVVKQ